MTVKNSISWLLFALQVRIGDKFQGASGSTLIVDDLEVIGE